jgi:plastocyanin
MATRSRLTSLLVVFAIACMAVAALGAAAGAPQAYASGAPGAPGHAPHATEQRAAEEPPAEATVQMAALQMSPQRLEITTGTTVTWVNGEVFDYPLVGGGHQIVADDKSWESPNIAPGTRWSRRFDLPGTFTYHCTRHSGATGEIVVTGEPILNRPVEQEVAITEPNPDDPTTWGFQPPDLVIETGTTVIWRNNGKNVHTATADDKSFDSGEIQPGATWKYTFDNPGAFAYHCTPHPWMKAQVRVVLPGGEAPPPVAMEHERQESAPAHRASSAPAERIGRGPVRHEVAIVEPDPAKPFEWGFDPGTLDVKVGDTVVWRNTGSAQHSVTSDVFDSKLIDPGAKWERTFTSVGVFNYRCTPHPWMKGVVRVSELDAEALPPLVVAQSAPGGGSAAGPQRAKEAARTGEGPVRHQALILEPDLTKAMEWRFDPPAIEARVGDTIEWRNTGTLAHTVTADSGTFDSGEIGPGKTFERTFDKPGMYAYHCTPHPWMKAMVRVADATGAAPELPAAAPGEQAAAPLEQAGKIGPFTIPPQKNSNRPFLIFPIWLAVAALIIALTWALAALPWAGPSATDGTDFDSVQV